jgi:hypothetical protein
MVTLVALVLVILVILVSYVSWVRARAYWSATFILRIYGKFTVETSMRATMKELKDNPEAYDRWSKWYLQGEPLMLNSQERSTLMITSWVSTPIPQKYMRNWVK